VQDIARDLANLAHQISSLKGEANNYLHDADYATFRLRLEYAHSAVEATARGAACSSLDLPLDLPQDHILPANLSRSVRPGP
jgi:hypothetical protein